MPKQKKLNIFIPAQALEHLQNGEDFNLREKLAAAVDRLVKTGDFFEPVAEKSYVFIENKKFHPESMGYTVEAKIS